VTAKRTPQARYNAKIRAARRALGLCRDCGAKTKGYRCDDCNAKKRGRNARWQELQTETPPRDGS